ncbi:hypothetical protein EUGRSUZ_K00256 [Eucalyptus grandis]|uniref:Uncharacterized protein n=2 Tax=Eucalyptus grandis TaxID=71139 RepID=A0ACC3IQN8_EUCGR|nr:hypothetical protein EUGRSUZ_K00256 [Eucalyptus grandis]
MVSCSGVVWSETLDIFRTIGILFYFKLSIWSPVIGINGNSSSICFEEERNALLQLRQSVSDPSHVLSSWNGEDCCRWIGVTCNRANGHVVKLQITSVNENPLPTAGESWLDGYYDDSFPRVFSTAGELTPSLLNLRYLSYLDLSGISFEHAYMPKFIGSMKQLRYLDLSDSFQFAIVPHEWGNLTELEVLDLHGYYHPGAVDDFQWLSHLQALKYLDMSGIHVNKSGDFMQVISALPYLSHLSLSNCGLYNFHLSFDCLANSTALHLEYLDLSMNSLEGPIPSIPFQNMTSLRHLYLFSNSFNSLVPRWFNSLRSLVNLNLADNLLQSIEGGLFSFLREHTFLESLCLNVNELHEEIFSVEGSSSGLIGENFKQLRIGKNMLQGTLPDWLFHLKNLTVLDLSYNQLHGIIPSPYDWVCLRVLLLSVNQLTGNILDAFGRLQVLSILDLSNNLLNGTIPQSLGQLQYLFSLDLSANSLRGTISKIHFSNLSKLQILDISNNHLAIEVDSDWIPPFNLHGSIPTSICEMEQLYDLHLGRNELVGEIPTCWKESPKSLLDISSNKLSGVIPSSLGNLIRLTSLHLNNNKLQGGIPVTIKYCRNLRILDLGENKIASSVPHWIGPSFPLLQILRLRENMFNGSIPSQLCLLSALQILDMAVNNMTGTIPNCLGHMKGLKLNKSIDEGNSLASPDIPTTDWTQEHVEQVVKGVDLDYTTLDLKLMVNLDLSSNKLVGPILRELTLLSGLRGLNLSRNFLSGGIPTMIGDMRLLESLDLLNNHLSGTIPQSFSAFISLSKLDLSHNNFTGPIPKGNQIQTLDDPSIYADNPLLCGDPLQKKCPKAEAPRAPKEVANEEGKLEKVMFYIVIMLGFAIGFWAVVGSLVYKKNWRQVYFNFVDRKVDMVYVIVAVKAAELRRRLRRV